MAWKDTPKRCDISGCNSSGGAKAPRVGGQSTVRLRIPSLAQARPAALNNRRESGREVDTMSDYEPPVMDTATTARFWSHVDQDGPAGCWEWRGSKRTNGYGYFVTARKKHQAHRLSYALTSGNIPDGMLACHHCDNKACVNPAHLFIGTVRDNAQDMIAKGRKPVTRFPQEACARGHKFEGHNIILTVQNGKRGRKCRTCARAVWRASWHRRALKAAVEREESKP